MKRIFYGDESGSITTSTHFKNRYFVIGFLSFTDTKDLVNIERSFRKLKVNYLKAHPETNLNIKKEIKGSDMSLDMKRYILTGLCKRHSITFNYAIIDNHKLYNKLRTAPHITFNYLISTYFNDNHKTNIKVLKLRLDDRNKAVDNLDDLQHYLQTNLYINTDIEKVFVSYHLSHNSAMIQVADIFCNLVHRYSTYYMNAKKPEKLIIKSEYLKLFNTLSPNIECYTSFPLYRSSFICPH